MGRWTTWCGMFFHYVSWRCNASLLAVLARSFGPASNVLRGVARGAPSRSSRRARGPPPGGSTKPRGPPPDYRPGEPAGTLRHPAPNRSAAGLAPKAPSPEAPRARRRVLLMLRRLASKRMRWTSKAQLKRLPASRPGFAKKARSSLPIEASARRGPRTSYPLLKPTLPSSRKRKPCCSPPRSS